MTGVSRMDGIWGSEGADGGAAEDAVAHVAEGPSEAAEAAEPGASDCEDDGAVEPVLAAVAAPAVDAAAVAAPVVECPAAEESSGVSSMESPC